MKTTSSRQVVAALGLALLLSGCSGVTAQDESSPSTDSRAPGGSSEAAPSADAQAAPAMPESAPTAVRIPATGTDSELLHLGLREDDTLEVPPTVPGSPASWYDKSPTPGELGPSILLGHVNEDDGGDGVFAGLRDLHSGDEIEIEREDGTTATFAVDYGEAYSKDDFATDKVYGNTDDAQLRLITCDGYDPETGLWDDNYVVYATLIA